MLAAILVPHRMQGVTRSYDYFMRGRKWFFGAFLLVQAIDIGDTFLKGYDWGVRPAVLITYSVAISVAIIGLIAERRPDSKLERLARRLQHSCSTCSRNWAYSDRVVPVDNS